MFWNSGYCVSTILSYNGLIIEYVFFISPQIFQIGYSENMNEMEVCVRPWYLWDVTLVCRDGNYKDWHKYLGTFGSGWAACCTGTCWVVELYLISLSLSEWAVYILWQPQSVQLPFWHMVPSPWPHQVRHWREFSISKNLVRISDENSRSITRNPFLFLVPFSKFKIW